MALKAGYKGIKNNLLNKLKAMPFISEIGDGLTLEDGELSATGGGGADLSVIAPAFSAETAYTAGEYVTYECKLYKFTTDHAAGAWDVSDVTEVTVSDDLEKTYKIDDATESTIVDADYVPFYDSSASVPKKSTWTNFCNKIKAKISVYLEQTVTFGTTDTTVTFTDSQITAGSIIDVYAGRSGGDVSGAQNTFSYKSIYTTTGICTIVFPALPASISVDVRIFLK